MDRITPQIIRTHIQKFIRATMADLLREEGFVSKDDQDICWYRIQSGTVVQSVYFFTQHRELPTFMEIGFGCHPLFLSPIFPNTPLIRNLPGNEILYPRYVLMDRNNRRFYSDEIWVSCPEDKSCAIRMLSEIVDTLNSVNTPYGCYELHKNWRKREVENASWIDVTPYFVDEVLYWNDQLLFPFCQKYISARSLLLQNAINKSPKSLKYKRELEYLDFLEGVMMSQNLDGHVQLLEKRANQTIQLLRKHARITQ